MRACENPRVLAAQVHIMAAANGDLERRLAAGPGEEASQQLAAVHEEVRPTCAAMPCAHQTTQRMPQHACSAPPMAP